MSWIIQSLIASYPSTSIWSGLVAYYKLDESSWNANPSVWANVLTNANVTYSWGKISNWANFNWSSSSLLNSTKLVSLASASAASISCWAKFSGTWSGQFVIDIVSTDNLRSITIDKNASNTISAFLYANTVQRVSSSFTVDTTNTIWYHVVLVKNTSDLLTFYVNGSSIGTVTVTWTQSLWASWWIWLWRHSGANANYLNGSVDEVGIWNRAITASEVTTLYNSGSWITY